MRFHPFFPIVSAAAAVLLSASCSDEHNSDPGATAPIELVAHQVSGCVSAPDSVFECAEDAELLGCEVAGDTLMLEIRYVANCCPEFVENVHLVDGSIDLQVVDLLHGCRCVCTYEDAFRIVGDIPAPPWMLRFRSRDDATDVCVSGLDTLVAR